MALSTVPVLCARVEHFHRDMQEKFYNEREDIALIIKKPGYYTVEYKSKETTRYVMILEDRQLRGLKFDDYIVSSGAHMNKDFWRILDAMNIMVKIGKVPDANNSNR